MWRSEKVWKENKWRKKVNNKVYVKEWESMKGK